MLCSRPGNWRGSRWYQSCCFGAVHYSSSFLGEIQDTSFAKKTYMRNVFFTLFALRFFSFFVLSGDQRCNRTHKWRPCPHIQCLQSDFLWSELISILTWVKAGVWSSQKIFSGFFLKMIIAAILTNWDGCFALDCSKQESPDLNKNPILPSLTTPNSCGSHTSVTS